MEERLDAFLSEFRREREQNERREREQVEHRQRVLDSLSAINGKVVSLSDEINLMKPSETSR